jgi:hypothetical protein
LPFASAPSDFHFGPSQDPFAIVVGKFILNCGSLEWVVIGWIRALTDEPILSDLAIQMPMSRRLELLESLLDARGVAQKDSERAHQTLQDARKLLEFRNRVAHGPLALGWRGAAKSGPPDAIGIPNFRTLRSRKAAPDDVVDLEGLEQLVANAVEVVESLHRLRQELDQRP